MAVYPRKQTVVIFAVCILAVGGTYFYVYGLPGRATAAKSISSAAPISVTASSETNIPQTSDWKKQFPSTSVSAKAIGSQKAASGEAGDGYAEEDLTSTGILGRNFMTRYAELSQTGLNADPNSVASAMNEVVLQSVGDVPPPKAYSSLELNIVPTTPSSLAAYDALIKSVINRYLSIDEAASIAISAFEHDDFKKLALIDPTIKSYRSIVSNLLNAQVPYDLSALHLKLLNGFSSGLYSAEAFRNINNDPLRGLAAIRADAISLLDIEGALAQIRGYLLSPKT